MPMYWEGNIIRLRAVEPSDAETHFQVNKDTNTFQMLDKIFPPASKSGVEKWAAETSLKQFDDDEYSFQMETLVDGHLVGHISTHDCDSRVGVFRYGINVLPGHQGKGCASEAIKLVLRYYFDELRYQKCNVHIYAVNTVSIRLHERAGFIEEGRLRRVVFTDGRFSDLLIYGITVEEFRDRNVGSRSPG